VSCLHRLLDRQEHVKAAENATRERNADFTTVMLEGPYTDAYLEQAGADAPNSTDDELRTIASPLDFIGINVYKPNLYVTPSDEAPGYRSIPMKSRPGTFSIPRPCIGRRAMCSRCGARSRSSSPRTDAERRMR
jgi:beta-glucosidase